MIIPTSGAAYPQQHSSSEHSTLPGGLGRVGMYLLHGRGAMREWGPDNTDQIQVTARASGTCDARTGLLCLSSWIRS